MNAEPPEDGNWSAWSQDAVRLLSERGRTFLEQRGIGAEATYDWDIDEALITFNESIHFKLICVGTTADDGTFLWSWANDALPESARRVMMQVHDYGQVHDLGLLQEPMIQGAHSEALEMMAIAGRVLNADGYWIEPDSGLYFLLFDVERHEA